jgi:hypothetical protein
MPGVGPRLRLVAAICFCLGLSFGLFAVVLAHRTRAETCAPGGRGYLCLAARHLPGARSESPKGGALLSPTTALPTPASTPTDQPPDPSNPPHITLGRSTLGVPHAEAIPDVVAPQEPVWLLASNFPLNAPVTLTLTAPDGTTCTIPPAHVTRFDTMLQAFVAPSDCASAAGNWTATFAASGVIRATANFDTAASGPVS